MRRRVPRSQRKRRLRRPHLPLPHPPHRPTNRAPRPHLAAESHSAANTRHRSREILRPLRHHRRRVARDSHGCRHLPLVGDRARASRSERFVWCSDSSARASSPASASGFATSATCASATCSSRSRSRSCTSTRGRQDRTCRCSAPSPRSRSRRLHPPHSPRSRSPSEERTLFAIGFAGALAAPFVTASEPGSVVMLLTYGWVVIALGLFAIRERGWQPVLWLTAVGAALYIFAAVGDAGRSRQRVAAGARAGDLRLRLRRRQDCSSRATRSARSSRSPFSSSPAPRRSAIRSTRARSR